MNQSKVTLNQMKKCRFNYIMASSSISINKKYAVKRIIANVEDGHVSYEVRYNDKIIPNMNPTLEESIKIYNNINI